MKLSINLIWGIVVLIVTGVAYAYSVNEQRIEALKLTHPKLAATPETTRKLAERATTHQASIDGKEGAKKLYDATDKVYFQIQKLYPNIPIDRATIRNIVQREYETMAKKGAWSRRK